MAQMTEWKKNYLKECKAKFPTYEDMIKVCTGNNLILNNSIIEKYEQIGFAEVYSGEVFDEDEQLVDIFQWFIIDENSAEFFAEYTNEIVYYLEEIDLYLLGVTHWGTPWSGVSANWKEI